MGDGEGRPPERRPLASRDLEISRRAARFLVRRGASPDSISVAGMLAGIAAGAALACTARFPDHARAAWIAAAVLVQARLAANMLDGMVAVETGRTSARGELFNEVPDRISDAAILIGLGYAAGGSPTLGWAAALAAVFTAYVRAEGRVAGAPQDYGGPLAKPQRMFVVTLVALHGGLSPAAWIPRWSGAALEGIPAWAALFLVVGTVATAAGRLLRVGRALGR